MAPASDQRSLPPRASRRVVLGLVVLAVALSAALAYVLTRDREAALPSEPTIAVEDFGSGITLGMRISAARAVPAAEGLAVEIIAREDLIDRDPYSQRPRDRDLLLVIRSGEDGADEVVAELRCYLGPNGSTATLQRQPAAQLDVNAVQELYGPPYDYSSGMDGRSHLTYYFAVPGQPRWSYKLTTSHEYDGGCFALALAQALSPQ